ncbi:MAG TPA: TerC family protein [Steroidobacteraceae bacterium]|nr:TerC family protein [Steroidobacteraceae bacterium]
MDLIVWGGFLCFFLAVLALDLGVLHREARVLSVPQALGWTLVWVSLALSFSVVVFGLYEYNWLDWRLAPDAPGGREALLQYVTGYLLEWSLSVDNIFVIALIFTYMRIPPHLQYRVLFWGIVGAIVLRGLMIAAGAALIHRFDWMFYVFGLVLLFSAARLLVQQEEHIDFESSRLLRMARRIYPTTDQLHGEKFFVRLDGRLTATPMFLALVLVESTDLMFAVDSIPAIFAVTQDPFLVFTSNAFAILGLRSLYFAVAGLMAMFRYLKISLVFILAFVGVKMLLLQHYKIPNAVSLSVIAGLLAIGIIASLWAMRLDRRDDSRGGYQ